MLRVLLKCNAPWLLLLLRCAVAKDSDAGGNIAENTVTVLHVGACAACVYTGVHCTDAVYVFIFKM